MTPDDEQLRSLAEDAAAHIEPPAGEQRLADDRLIASFGQAADPQMNVVSRLRLEPAGVAEAVEDVRGWYRRLGRRACTWEVTTASTPPDLHQRLVALGMRPDDEPHMLALACTEEPRSDTPGVTVEAVRTDDQLALVSSIFREDDGFDPPEEWLRAAPRWLARVDGEAVATADITEMDTAVFLGGAVTVPRARGRGAYRALVAARWQEAVRLGKPVLVTQSEPMSQPILTRLGFRVVGEIRVLVDEFGP
jgi:hypothetical protein